MGVASMNPCATPGEDNRLTTFLFGGALYLHHSQRPIQTFV
ncbi:hypothetical protein PG5_52730 [Pseudomonas sp. G5(2012)]|nr:hypothetical protein PG5_52730 [Pseudomonas sp. G5(2012)]